MANEISTKLVDLPAIISSPDLLGWRRISLGTINHPGMRPRKYLPAGLTLTDEKRAQITKRIGDLRSIAEADSSPPNTKARLALLAKMLMGYPMGNVSEAANEARAEAYLVA